MPLPRRSRDSSELPRPLHTPTGLTRGSQVHSRARHIHTACHGTAYRHLEREVRQARFEGGVRTKHILLAVVFMLTLVVIAATAVWAMLRGRKPTDVLSESEKARVQRAMLLVKARAHSRDWPEIENRSRDAPRVRDYGQVMGEACREARLSGRETTPESPRAVQSLPHAHPKPQPFASMCVASATVKRERASHGRRGRRGRRGGWQGSVAWQGERKRNRRLMCPRRSEPSLSSLLYITNFGRDGFCVSFWRCCRRSVGAVCAAAALSGAARLACGS